LKHPVCELEKLLVAKSYSTQGGREW